MAAVIKLKRGTSTPSTSDIANGEVAVDTSAAKLYINDSGTVKEIGGGGGGGVTSDAQRNTVAGTNAGANFSGTSASDNTLFGYDAGNDITSGDKNVFIGKAAGEKQTTGAANIAIGHNAFKTSTSGQYNVAIGRSAGEKINSNKNVAVGYEALADATSSEESVFIGWGAGTSITTGSFNVGIGQYAGAGEYNNATGNYNTSIGHEAGKRISTGSSNSVLGVFSGDNITTGSNNVCIGANSGDTGTNNLTTGSNNILIGHDSQATAADVSNEITIGDTNITKFRIPGLNFVVKDTTATDNYVLTVDANGEAGWEAAAGGGLSNIVEDTTPQLGGALDGQNNNMSNIGTIDGSNLQLDFGSVA